MRSKADLSFTSATAPDKATVSQHTLGQIAIIRHVCDRHSCFFIGPARLTNTRFRDMNMVPTLSARHHLQDLGSLNTVLPSPNPEPSPRLPHSSLFHVSMCFWTAANFERGSYMKIYLRTNAAFHTLAQAPWPHPDTRSQPPPF